MRCYTMIVKAKYRLYIWIMLVFLGLSLKGQVTTYPLNFNASIQRFLVNNPAYSYRPILKTKYGKKDTLSLPFFDDFSEHTLYPDSTKWLNNQVYINNHFPHHPPSLNVATFDGLDQTGNPYKNTINKDFSGPGDSLISQAINLNDSMGYPYAIKDSIVFSFFYQPNGFGYHLNGEDSLRLWFKASNGLWIQVWSIGGVSTTQPFKHVSIPILDPNYLHKGFQFMFTTYTRQVGNANHWHIDYILLDNKRKSRDDSYNDYAIQNNPSPLLNEFVQMPYGHFSVNPSKHIADSVYVRVSNLYNTAKTLQIREEASFNGSEIWNTAFLSSTKNIGAQVSSIRDLPSYTTIQGLSNSGEVIINRIIEVRENGVTNDYKRNDSIKSTQSFGDFYAYDDGTAEQGFGFDQNTNPNNIEGQIAYGFTVEKEDTMYAISTFFNQAVYDVSRTRFKYRIWKELEGIDSGEDDIVIYESEELSPVYSTVQNWRSFTPHYLDTALLLSPGRYYIGWWQGTMFNLNVGWDKNYGYSKYPEKVNSSIYFKTFAGWSNDGMPSGTLMMRPHFGIRKELYASDSKFQRKNNTASLYPNPSSKNVFLNKLYESIQISSMQGKIVARFWNSSNFDVSVLDEGMYVVFLVDENGQHHLTKLIVRKN